MIYSSTDENFRRIKIMTSIAHKCYFLTKNSDYRERILNGGDIFPFILSDQEAMEEETCMVGLIKAWCVVTLESLINEALVDVLNDKELAAKAIEFPSKLLPKNAPRSDLEKKLTIINDYCVNKSDKSYLEKIISISSNLSNKRNSIIHDKPFEFVYEGAPAEGEVIGTHHYRKRGGETDDNNRDRFEDLKSFFFECDEIRRFILDKTEIYSDKTFISMLTS